MQYLTLIHIDPALLDALPAGEFDRLMRGCFEKADALRDSGCLLGSQQLEDPPVRAPCACATGWRG
ncbi:hypothetical protein LJB71_04000 [Thermomonas sp. S9]|nr:hypothetical protein [Thermomonas sp. S9]